MQSQLEGASQQLTQFHAALEHKDASLAQLQSEHWALRDAMAEMEARLAAEKASYGPGGAHAGLADELAQARDEESRLRGALQRCYADYTAAVDALSKAEEAAHPAATPHARLGAYHAGHGDAGGTHGMQHSTAHWRSGAHAAPEQRAPLWADEAEASRYYASMANRY